MNHDFGIKIVSTGEYSGCLEVVYYSCWKSQPQPCEECWTSQFRWGTQKKAQEYLDLIKDLPNFREG